MTPRQTSASIRRPTVLPMGLVVLALFFATSAVYAQTTRVAHPVNKMCPVLRDEKASPDFTKTYHGQVIGFCCDKCLSKFEANPSRYAGRLNDLLASQSSSTETAHDDRGHDESTAAGAHDHRHAHSDTDLVGKANGAAHADSQHHDMDGHESDEASTSEHGEHEHDHHHHDHEETSGFVAKLIDWLGKFHPATVHFPIGMLVGAGIAELLLMITKRHFFAIAGRYCLWVGALGAVVAAVLGWFFGGFHTVDEMWVMTTHRWLGTATALFSILILGIGERVARRPSVSRVGFRVVLFVGVALVSLTGFFGGSLIYGLNHFAWP